MKDILILYYSKNDSTKKMARAISRGIESVDSITSTVRTVDSDIYKDSDDTIVSKDYKKSVMLAKKALNEANMAYQQYDKQKDKYRFLD